MNHCKYAVRLPLGLLPLCWLFGIMLSYTCYANQTSLKKNIQAKDYITQSDYITAQNLDFKTQKIQAKT